jgi:hypothetical protein
MHHGPTDSGIFAVRAMVFREELVKMLRLSQSKELHREYLFKRGLVFDNGEGAKQREFHRLFAK